MIIGPPLKKECPYCGAVKELTSLRSGNTLRASHWSDTKSIYPMLPKNSEVQKCPGCGKYYFLTDAKTLLSEEESFQKYVSELLKSMKSLNDEPV